MTDIQQVREAIEIDCPVCIEINKRPLDELPECPVCGDVGKVKSFPLLPCPFCSEEEVYMEADIVVDDERKTIVPFYKVWCPSCVTMINFSEGGHPLGISADYNTRHYTADRIEQALQSLDGKVMVDTTKESEDQRIIREAYDYQVDYDGFLWGLTAGDHGFEKTSIKCIPDTTVLVDEGRLDEAIVFIAKRLICPTLMGGAIIGNVVGDYAQQKEWRDYLTEEVSDECED